MTTRIDDERSPLGDDSTDLASVAQGADFFADAVASPAKAAGVAPPPPRSARFGRYVLGEVLGSGAMGIVYAARDPVLDRKLAIKVLKPAAGADAAARMVKEARAVARLTHPNVVAIHDVGVETDQVFLAMEHIDGQTLKQWLAEAPRSVGEVTAACVQAARGLAAAHRARVVHRDFKPANVLVGKDGRVCVSDFGLAHILEAAPSEPPADGDDAPATDVARTATGALVGTPAYMAPEQFGRQPANERSDQFSFAVTLFEALYGSRPFAGKNWSEIRDSVAAGRLARVNESRVPARTRRALRRALAQAPADRYPSMDALIADLEPPRRRAVWLAGAMVVAGGGAAALFALRPARPVGPPEVVVKSTRRLTFDPGCEEYPSFFPDGKRIVYDALVEGDSELLALDLDSGARRRLTHDPGWDVNAAVSPDGKRIVYKHSGPGSKEFRVVAAAGDEAGAPLGLGTGRGAPGWSWDGKVLLGGQAGEVFAIDPVSAARVKLALLPDGAGVRRLSGLPGGATAMIWERATEVTAGELLPDGTLRAREDKLYRNEQAMTVSPGGRGYYTTRQGPSGPILVWRAAGAGDPVVIAGEISPSFGMAASPDGRRFVWSTCRQSTFVARVGGAGPLEPLSRGDWVDFYPRRLGDKRLLFQSDRAGRLQLWSYDLANAEVKALAPLGTHSGSASNDGRTLVYLDPDRGPGVWMTRDGGAPRQLTTGASDDMPQVAADGERVVFERNLEGIGARLFVVAPGAEPRPISDAGCGQPAVSPVDDKVVCLDSTEDGGYLPMLLSLGGGPQRPIPGLARGEWRIPRISADGKRLLLVRRIAEIVEAPLDGQGAPVVRWAARTERVATAEYAPDGDGIIASIVSYDGDLWLAEGQFP